MPNIWEVNMPRRICRELNIKIDWDAYELQLRQRLGSPEGKQELETIRECSRAARKRFERAERVDAQLMRRPMTS